MDKEKALEWFDMMEKAIRDDEVEFTTYHVSEDGNVITMILNHTGKK